MAELFSVVIPAYNASRFIGAAVASVLDQTYGDVEIIVVDDCSTDDTARELERFGDGIRVVRHETNKGASEARNTGVRQCRGELVAFLDSDDLWVPQKLEIFAECLRGHPEVLLAVSDFSRFQWSDGACYALSNSQIFPMIFDVLRPYMYSGRKFFVLPKARMFEMLLRGYPIYPSAIAVRRRIFEAMGYWRKTRTNEDFDFGLRCCRATDCLYIDETLSMVGRHDENLSLDTHRQTEGDIAVLDAHLADPRYSREERDLIRYFRGMRLCGLGYAYREAGETIKAIRKYFEAMKNGGWHLHSLARICHIAAKDLLGSTSYPQGTPR